MVLGISIRALLYAAYFAVAQIASMLLLEKTDGYRNLGWSVVVSALFLSSYVVFANLVRDGAPLSILSPVLSAICPLFIIIGAVIFLGENVSWMRFGLLVSACGLIGVASKY